VIVLRFLRTVLGLPFIFLSMVICASLIWLFGERPQSEAVLRVWCKLVLAVAGARVIARRSAQLDPKKSYVFVCNHTSNMDVPAVLATTPMPLRFIAKRELSKVPFFGAAARRMGHVFIDRKDAHGAAKAIRARISRGFDTGVALFFFAEGTPANEVEASVASSTTILDEDRVIREVVQRNYASGLYDGGLLSPRHEGGVAYVQELVLRASGSV